MVNSSPIRLGVMGFSSQIFDKKLALDALLKEFKALPEGSVIVSGLTNIGIPGLAYNLAYLFGFSTVGIACSKAKNYPVYPCKKVIIYGDNWGEESETFVNFCDSFLMIGGGLQSKKEAEMAEALGKKVTRYTV